MLNRKGDFHYEEKTCNGKPGEDLSGHNDPDRASVFLFQYAAADKRLYLQFYNFKGYGNYDFVGLRNYVDLFSDGRVGRSYLFTFKFALVSTILVNVLSLILALGLNSKIKAKSALRAVYFLPNILGGLVVGYIFSFFFTYILPAAGKAAGIEWLSSSMLSNTKTAWLAIVVVACWQSVAMNTIIYIAGLQTVPEDVYEAGAIDGASGWRKFKNLTFPLIMPFFTINMVLCMKNFLMVFDQIMGVDKRRPFPEYRVHFLSDLSERYGRRTVWIPERQRSAFLRGDRGDLCIPDDSIK